MAGEDKKDFNAMLHDAKDMPKLQIVTDEATIKKYGGERMYFAPPAAYDALVKGSLRESPHRGGHPGISGKGKRRGFHRAHYCWDFRLHRGMGKLPALRG